MSLVSMAGGASFVLEDSAQFFIFLQFFPILVSVPFVQQWVQREIVTSDLFQIPA